MIGKLTGRVDYRDSDHVLLDVQGVGYVVYCSERTLAALPNDGLVSLYTELLVREDLLQLFGFRTRVEREWHRLLTTVQGVGAKAAMAMLGTLGPEGVGRAIALGDVAAIKATPGVGPKIAQRVTHELREKAPKIMALGGEEPADVVIEPPSDAPKPASKPAPVVPQASASATSDALSALTNLGYAPAEAASAVAQVSDDNAEASDLIKAALKLLAPKG